MQFICNEHLVGLVAFSVELFTTVNLAGAHVTDEYMTNETCSVSRTSIRIISQ